MLLRSVFYLVDLHGFLFLSLSLSFFLSSFFFFFLIIILVQVFYYLGELNDSLTYALGASSLFDVSEDSDYVHTLLGKFSDVAL